MWGTVLQIGLNAGASGLATGVGAYAVRRAGLETPNPLAVSLGTAVVVLGASAAIRYAGNPKQKKEEP